MESKNYKIRREFISKEEANKVKKWVDSLKHSGEDMNYHLSEISKDLKGKACIFDVSQTELTKYITKYQSVSDVSTENLPDFIHGIILRISTELNLPTRHIFLQAVDMNKGGKIKPHYDASIDGHINYKCNISVLSEKYNLYIDKEVINIEERDLYCFESSLYKHWTDEFNSRRVFLSIGFIIPYSCTGRTDNDPRVRLSKRIGKYFQKI